RLPAEPILVLASVTAVRAHPQPSIYLNQLRNRAIGAQCIPEVSELAIPVLRAAIRFCIGRMYQNGFDFLFFAGRRRRNESNEYQRKDSYPDCKGHPIATCRS